jgi:hypothetical protein
MLHKHWSEKWVGVPYSEGNCLEFVARVLREQFGIDKKLPALHEHELLCQELFTDRANYAVRLPDDAQLEDGVVVALRPGAAVMHVGVLVVGPTELHVLHNSVNHGSSVLQPLRLVRRLMRVEGFYDARN